MSETAPPEIDSPTNQRLRRSIVLILVFYWLAAFGATHLPVHNLVDLPKNSDKGAHFLIYTGLAFLLGLLLHARGQWRNWNYAIIFAITVAYSVIDELLQIPVNRTADFADGAADAVGALVGLVLLYFARPMITRLLNREAEQRVERHESRNPSPPAPLPRGEGR